MTHITAIANLAHTPVLRQNTDTTPYCLATVIVTERVQRDGQWIDRPPVRLQVHVHGEQACNLAAVAQTSGNTRVTFAGELKIRPYAHADGSVATGFYVRSREIGLSLRGQIAGVTRPDCTPIGARRITADPDDGRISRAVNDDVARPSANSTWREPDFAVAGSR